MVKRYKLPCYSVKLNQVTRMVKSYKLPRYIVLN